jgi:hypothetical protein
MLEGMKILVAILALLLLPEAAHADPVTSTIAALKTFFTISISVSAKYAAIATAAAAAFNAAVANFVLGKISQTLFGAKARGGIASSQQFTVRAALAPREIVYGEARKSGVLMWEGTSGTNGRFLWRVMTIAGHQVDAMTDVWLGPDLISSASIDGFGNVTSGTYAGKVSIYRLLGTDGQNVQADLDSAFSEITTDFRARGRALLIVRMDRDDKVFQNGPPQNIFVLVRGKRVYDPRLDSTNGGSGPQRLNNATTWAWSDNPALCAADYATGGSTVFDVATPKDRLGVRVPSARIDWPLVISSANKCAETPAVPGGTQQRYRCNGVLITTATHEENLDRILESMHGNRVFTGGRLRIYAGAFDAPSESINDDDLGSAGYKVQGSLSETETFNQVSAAYIDRSRGWVEASSFIRTDAAFESTDGKAILRNIQLPMVTDEYQAQRIAEIVKQQSRNQITVELSLKLSALKIAPWDTFYLSLSELGWSDRVFRASAISINLGERTVKISAREESSGAYADLAAGEYSTAGSAVASRQNESPDAPTALAVTSFPQSIGFVVTLPEYFPPDAVLELWEHTASTPFSSAVLVEVTRSNRFFIPKRDTTARFYWVRTRIRGQVSDTFPAVTGSSAAADVVQTADVAGNAVNDVYSLAVVGPVDISHAAPGFDSTNMRSVASLTIPAVPFASEHIVTFVGRATISFSSASQSLMYGQILHPGSSADFLSVSTRVLAQNPSTTLLSDQRMVSITRRLSVPANFAQAHTFWAQMFGVTGTYTECSIRDGLLLVEVRKR